MLVPTTLTVFVVVVVPEFIPVILTVLVVAPVLHEYVFAPVAVNIAEEPEHTVPEGEGVTVKLGKGYTVTETLAVLVQVFAAVAVTVYTSVPIVVGVAVTVPPVIGDKPPPKGSVHV